MRKKLGDEWQISTNNSHNS
jgi:hypothetical protein